MVYVKQYTIEELIESKRIHLNNYRGEDNWEQVHRTWKNRFGEEFELPPREVYANLCKNRYFTIIKAVSIVCEICEEHFDYDEEFVELHFDRGGWYDVHISCHKKCLKELGE